MACFSSLVHNRCGASVGATVGSTGAAVGSAGAAVGSTGATVAAGVCWAQALNSMVSATMTPTNTKSLRDFIISSSGSYFWVLLK
jgi:hypothetical protein